MQQVSFPLNQLCRQIKVSIDLGLNELLNESTTPSSAETRLRSQCGDLNDQYFFCYWCQNMDLWPLIFHHVKIGKLCAFLAYHQVLPQLFSNLSILKFFLYFHSSHYLLKYNVMRMIELIPSQHFLGNSAFSA